MDRDVEEDITMATVPATVIEVLSDSDSDQDLSPETETSGVQLSDDQDSGPQQPHPNSTPVRTSTEDEGIAMETREGPVTIQVEDGDGNEEETSFVIPSNEDNIQAPRSPDLRPTEEDQPEHSFTPIPLLSPSSLPGSGRSTPLGNIPPEGLADVEMPPPDPLSPRRLEPLSPPYAPPLPQTHLTPLGHEPRPATAASISLVTVSGAVEDGAAPTGEDPPSYNDILPSYEAVMAQGEEPLETWRLMGGRPSQVVMETSFGPTISTAVSARRTDLPANAPQTERQVTFVDPDVEVASSRQPDQPDGAVARLPWLSRRVEGVGLSVRTLLISLFVGLCALLLVGLLPPSFAYVDYYHYGLKKQRSTGVVNTKVVYGTGRYAIGPDFEFKLFPRGAHVVQLNDLAIFTSDLLEVVINCSFQHFLRKDEVGLLHDKFDLEYEPVLYRVAYSTIKETATLYSTVNFMSSRPEIEVAFHRALRERLQGDCCTGDNATQPAFCRPPPDCDMGYHTDVRYFQLLSVNLPALIVERSMTALTLQIDAEKEQFIQDDRVTRKVTEAMRQSILNQADQIRANGTARAALVLSRAYAQTNQTTEMSHIDGLQLMYSNLNISQEEEKASLHWIRALEKHPRLHRGISFQDYVSITQRSQP
ncbi:Hypp8688 [Branchiostoma lanceolatum]|uniref:Hypp8688 protein n=1 Tax=Branchiostoma lanceolatum TaxID=7740 RepID=A0A8J9ZAL6_BRALA|nr:Hypp8688 [Branchiostoma lanceolatum]